MSTRCPKSAVLSGGSVRQSGFGRANQNRHDRTPPSCPSRDSAGEHRARDFSIAAPAASVYQNNAVLDSPQRPSGGSPSIQSAHPLNSTPPDSTPPGDPVDPPRKFYGLKPRDYDTVNGPPRPPPADTLPAGPDPGIAPAAAGPITVQNLRAVAAGSQPLLGVNAPVNRPNDVHGLLNLNRQRDRQAAADVIIISAPRPSRRKRDFWLLVVLINGGCVGFTGLITHFDLAVMMFGLGAGLFLTIALAWIMWFVMDNY